RTWWIQTLIDKGLSKECRSSGRRRAGVAGSGRGGEELLRGGKEIRSDSAADSAAGKASVRLPAAARRSGLNQSAADVRAGRHELRLLPTIVRRPPTGEVRDVVRAVGVGIGDTAAVSSAKGLDTLGGPDRSHILRRSRR